jgi:hypothetical protein
MRSSPRLPPTGDGSGAFCSDVGKKNHVIEVSGLRGSWIVTLSCEAKINKVIQAPPELLRDLQDNPRPKRPPWDIEPSELDRLGITRARPTASNLPGRVYLLPKRWGGFAGTEHTVGEWVTRILDEQADVAAKLAANRGVAERHAFIWTTLTSDMEVQTQLEPGDDHPFPVTAPTLPTGVTHVWVADMYWSQGVLAWFPDGGWASNVLQKWPLTRADEVGSKQTRTADPLLASYRRRVRCRTPVSGNPYL